MYWFVTLIFTGSKIEWISIFLVTFRFLMRRRGIWALRLPWWTTPRLKMNGNRHTMVTKRSKRPAGDTEWYGINKMSFRACAWCLSVGDSLLPGETASVEQKKSNNCIDFSPSFPQSQTNSRICQCLWWLFEKDQNKYKQTSIVFNISWKIKHWMETVLKTPGKFEAPTLKHRACAQKLYSVPVRITRGPLGGASLP